MRILICAATFAEASACKKGLKRSKQNNLDQNTYSVLTTGMGIEAASNVLYQYLKSNAKPDLVISTGFAGTYSLDLSIGDWVWGDAVYLWKNPAASPELELIWSKADIPGFSASALNPRSGIVVTAPVVINYANIEKPESPIYGSPIVVDMESAGLANICKQRGVPFAVLRIITDTPSTPFPDFVGLFATALFPEEKESAAYSKRFFTLTKAMTSVAKSPTSVPKFIMSSRTWVKWLESGWFNLSNSTNSNKEVIL